MSNERIPNQDKPSEPRPTSLDEILIEYGGLNSVDFRTLQGWESRLHDPHDLLRLYHRVTTDRVLAGEGAISKELEAGLWGYIKGQMIRATDRSEELSATDGLTGLLNRRSYDRDIDKYIGIANRLNHQKRKSVYNIALINIDINNFKHANDTYGHPFGDEILRYVAEALNEEFSRPTDLKYRNGGDEFIVLIDQFSQENVEEYLKKLTFALNDFVQRKIATEHPEIKTDISVSVGMSVYGRDAKTKEELNTHADYAMYHAKRNPVDTNLGKLHFHLYSPGVKYPETRKK